MVVNEGTVGLSGSAVHVVSTAEPVLHWAASSWAHCSLTLLLGSHLGQLLLGGNKGAVGLSGSAVHVVSTAEPVLHWAASSWAHGSLTLLLGGHLGQLLP